MKMKFKILLIFSIILFIVGFALESYRYTNTSLFLFDDKYYLDFIILLIGLILLIIFSLLNLKVNKIKFGFVLIIGVVLVPFTCLFFLSDTSGRNINAHCLQKIECSKLNDKYDKCTYYDCNVETDIHSTEECLIKETICKK